MFVTSVTIPQNLNSSLLIEADKQVAKISRSAYDNLGKPV